MPTTLISTAIALLDDDDGINEHGYTKLLELVYQNYGPEVADRLNSIVDATDGYFYISQEHGTPEYLEKFLGGIEDKPEPMRYNPNNPDTDW